MGRCEPLIARLESKYIPEPNTGCWLWTGITNNKGYGQMHIYCRDKKGPIKRLAHRISYEELVGPIPDGLCVLHKCDVPLCVNPRHLWLGTKADNNRDMKEKGRKRLLRLMRERRSLNG